MIRIFPAQKDFYQMLTDQTAKTEEGLVALGEFLKEPTPENAKKVKHIEHEADELRRILMDELNKTFVTALDREDIYILSKSIDDVIDYAETTAEEMILFELTSDESINKMVELLHEAARHIHLAVLNLGKHNNVCVEHLIRVRKAENEIEKAYRHGLVELFKSEDVIKILKMREVYRHLSNAADRAVEATNILGSILIKTS